MLDSKIKASTSTTVTINAYSLSLRKNRLLSLKKEAVMIKYTGISLTLVFHFLCNRFLLGEKPSQYAPE